MKKRQLLSALFVMMILALPFAASAQQQPEMIVEKMSAKFIRGIANTATCVVELPKQTILTARDMGAVGYIVGPVKGIGMTIYRGVIGVAEAVFFLVPQPGYYDPMIDPAYVWDGWGAKRDTSAAVPEESKLEEKTDTDQQ